MGKPHTEEAVLDYSAYFNKCHSNNGSSEVLKLKWKGSQELSKMFFLRMLKTAFDPPHTTHTEETDYSASTGTGVLLCPRNIRCQITYIEP